MTRPKPDANLSTLTQLSLARAEAMRYCPGCHIEERWDYETNGDGGVIAICQNCGYCVPLGKYWQDPAVGVRIPARSQWSALHTRRV